LRISLAFPAPITAGMPSSLATISVKDVFETINRVREVYNRTGSVGEALKARGILTPHEVLRVIVEEKLKRMSYRIVGRGEAPEFMVVL
jgi:hypothetical protein